MKTCVGKLLLTITLCQSFLLEAHSQTLGELGTIHNLSYDCIVDKNGYKRVRATNHKGKAKNFSKATQAAKPILLEARVLSRIGRETSVLKGVLRNVDASLPIKTALTVKRQRLLKGLRQNSSVVGIENDDLYSNNVTVQQLLDAMEETNAEIHTRLIDARVLIEKIKACKGKACVGCSESSSDAIFFSDQYATPTYRAELCVQQESCCKDGKDNDSDGLVDCEDPDCVGKSNCEDCGDFEIPGQFVIKTAYSDNHNNCGTISLVQWSDADDEGATAWTVHYTWDGDPRSYTTSPPFDDTFSLHGTEFTVPGNSHWDTIGGGSHHSTVNGTADCSDKPDIYTEALSNPYVVVRICR